jgi:hypothetical protein
MGVPAPGAGNDQFLYGSVSASNSRGQSVVYGGLADPATPTTETGAGYWLLDHATSQFKKIELGPVYEAATDQFTSGDGAPGFNATFKEITTPTLNDRGVVAFTATVNAPGIPSGVWRGKPGALELVVKSGATAPVPGNPTTFSNFSGFDQFPMSAPEINGRDQVAFVAKLAGTGVTMANDRAMFLASSAQDVRLIAREGDRAPGTPDGVVFQQFSSNPAASFQSPTLNARGQSVFYGVLTGPGVTTSNDVGLWAVSTLGEAYLIAREGQQVQLTSGLTGVVTSIGFRGGTGGEEGRSSGLNDAGQLAISLGLSNPSITGATSAVVLVQIPDLAADFNGDGTIDALDLAAWSQHVGASGAARSAGDADGDGDVDGADYLYWQSTQGQSVPSSMALTIPEPGGLLLACGLVGLLYRRHHLAGPAA